MSNAVLPTMPGLGWNLVRTPQFDTLVSFSVTRRRTAVALMPYPVYNYSLVFDILRTTAAYSYEFQQMLSFFNTRAGNYDSFLIDDVDDDSVTTQLIGSGDGATLAFQLIRTLPGANGFAQPVYEINATPTPLIYVDGVLQSAANYDITMNKSGTLTFHGGHAPANGKAITATFKYYWRVSFKDPTLDFTKFMQSRYQLATVDLLGETP